MTATLHDKQFFGLGTAGTNDSFSGYVPIKKGWSIVAESLEIYTGTTDNGFGEGTKVAEDDGAGNIVGVGAYVGDISGTVDYNTKSISFQEDGAAVFASGGYVWLEYDYFNGMVSDWDIEYVTSVGDNGIPGIYRYPQAEFNSDILETYGDYCLVTKHEHTGNSGGIRMLKTGAQWNNSRPCMSKISFRQRDVGAGFRIGLIQRLESNESDWYAFGLWDSNWFGQVRMHLSGNGGDQTGTSQVFNYLNAGIGVWVDYTAFDPTKWTGLMMITTPVGTDMRIQCYATVGKEELDKAYPSYEKLIDCIHVNGSATPTLKSADYTQNLGSFGSTTPAAISPTTGRTGICITSSSVNDALYLSGYKLVKV